uniref:Major facilitator superfamily (MFS) profile domain-containing protein n=1 Tax=Ditylenchus dipsaci TaxID=166011 RepID=A0A915DSZ8_9BILA
MQNEERLQISQGVRLKLIFLAAAMSFSSIFQMGYSNAYVNTAIESFRLFLNQSLGNDKIVMTSSMYTWIWQLASHSLTDKCGRKS